jgi:hypothetical protein
MVGLKAGTCKGTADLPDPAARVLEALRKHM